MSEIAEVAYTSSLYRVETEVFHADINNTIGDDITDQIITCLLDGDTQRHPGKKRIELEALDPDVLPPNQWVAPFVTVVPETGPIVRKQKGLYRLGVASIRTLVDGPIAQSAGDDVVGAFQGAMPEEVITPARIVLMDEVAVTLERASLKYCGPNMLPNPDFAGNTTAGWVVGGTWTGTSHGMVVADDADGTAPNYFAGIEYGEYAYRLRATNAGAPVGSTAYLITNSSERILIPNTMGEAYGEAYVYMNSVDLSARLEVVFYDAAGTEIAGTRLSSTGDVDPYRRPIWPDSWVHLVAYGALPAGAVRCSVLVTVKRYSNTVTTGDVWAVVDYVALREAIGPMYTKYQLPRDWTLTRARIAHQAQTLWRTRISDLLNSRGYHDIYSDDVAIIKTELMRDRPNAAPAATYAAGENGRLVEQIDLIPSTGNLYNTVRAVSEDYTNGLTLTATAVNRDASHPWSVQQIGERAPSVPLTVMSVVDEEDLKAAADAYLARASMNQSLELAVLPDLDVTLHSIIQMEGGGPEAGRWNVESYEFDAGPDGDGLLHIVARRSIKDGWG